MSLDKPSHTYPGAGTEDDPFVVSFGELDPDSPKSWSTTRKWTFMLICEFRSTSQSVRGADRVHRCDGNDVCESGTALNAMRG